MPTAKVSCKYSRSNQDCRWSMHVQEQIKCAQVAIRDSEESGEEIDALPAELFKLARPEKAALRLEVDNETAFFAILDGLAELGWPPILGDSDPAR